MWSRSEEGGTTVIDQETRGCETGEEDGPADEMSQKQMKLKKKYKPKWKKKTIMNRYAANNCNLSSCVRHINILLLLRTERRNSHKEPCYCINMSFYSNTKERLKFSLRHTRRGDF